MDEHAKNKLDKEIRSKCLDRAISLYGGHYYTAAAVKIGRPEEIISAAKAFYTYIKKGE